MMTQSTVIDYDMLRKTIVWKFFVYQAKFCVVFL